MAGLVLLALLSLFSSWLTDVDKMEAIRYVTAMVGVISLGLLWSGDSTLANRIFAGQTRFGRHLFIAGCGVLVLELASLVLSPSAYALSLEAVSRYGNHIVIAIAAGVVYFHLITISPANARRHAFTAGFLLLLGSGLTLAFNYQNRGAFSEELFMSELYPPSLRLTSDHTVDQFLAASQKLKAGIDEERAALRSEDGEEDDGEFD